jgi:hypothetical protein
MGLSSHLLSEFIKIRIYKTVILPVVLYVCEPWSLDMMAELGGTKSSCRIEYHTLEMCEGVEV